VVHPRWGVDDTKGKADIALIKLSAPATTPTIDISEPPGLDATVRMIGWGRTIDGDPASIPLRLLQLDTKRLEVSSCYFGEYSATIGDLCVQRPKGGAAGACNGDSGSPLLWKTGGRWRLLGVDSRSGGEVGCLNTDEVYTSAAHYAQWIAQVVAG
jgi:secreted trypsin-like serine protease